MVEKNMNDDLEAHRANQRVQSDRDRLVNSRHVRWRHSLADEVFCGLCNFLPLHNVYVSLASLVTCKVHTLRTSTQNQTGNEGFGALEMRVRES